MKAKTPLNNARLEVMLEKALEADLRGGQYLLDCFMGRKIWEDISPCIHTRFHDDNNNWILEIEDVEDTNGKEGGGMI